MSDETDPIQVIRDACPRAKAGFLTVLVSDCEWCSAAERAVAIAVASERERCARVAEEFTEYGVAEKIRQAGSQEEGAEE